MVRSRHRPPFTLNDLRTLRSRREGRFDTVPPAFRDSSNMPYQNSLGLLENANGFPGIFPSRLVHEVNALEPRQQHVRLQRVIRAGEQLVAGVNLINDCSIGREDVGRAVGGDGRT